MIFSIVEFVGVKVDKNLVVYGLSFVSPLNPPKGEVEEKTTK
jgi:hypothetical protein